MFDRYRRPSLILLATACLVAGCASPASPTPSPSASQGPGASPSPSAPPEASPSAAAVDLEALTREITGQVEELRGLKAKEPVTVTVLDEAALIEHVEKSFTEDNPPELVAGTDGLFTRMGLIPADADIGDLYVELLGSQIIGLYDNETKQLYVVSRGEGEPIGAVERFTMSHEIDHALQDQHFDLSTILPHDTDQSDRSLAALSLPEGDASLLMFLWAQRHLSLKDFAAVIAGASDPTQTAILAKMPRILRDTLQFPYTQGLTFILDRQRPDGWPGVDELYAKPPASTEQILHPEKYEAGEQPVVVDIPDDLASRIGDGWTIGLEDTLGEFQASIWLADPGKVEQKTADAAAAGWAGDRVAYLTGPEGADAVFWDTMWDSPAEATEFADAANTASGSVGSPMLVSHLAGSNEVTILIASDDETLVKVDAVAGHTGA